MNISQGRPRFCDLQPHLSSEDIPGTVRTCARRRLGSGCEDNLPAGVDLLCRLSLEETIVISAQILYFGAGHDCHAAQVELYAQRVENG